jgi:GNAT superfamily N-acetyltransferase
MKINITVAKPEDANRLADLLRQMGYEVSEADTAKRIKLYGQPAYRLLLAKTEEMAVGFIALHFYDVLHLPATEGRISSFCVDEKVRGKGIGKALLAAAEDYFKENGCYKIVLNSNLKRPETHQFYLNRGYQFTSKHFAKFLENV